MSQEGPTNFEILLNSITPPKGIKRKNVEGYELLDCDSDENEDSDEDLEDDEIDNSEITRVFSKDPDVKATLPVSTKAPKLSNMCQDADTDKDAEFLDQLQSLIDSHETSKLFTPHISKLRNMNHEARASVKKRIQKCKSENKIVLDEPNVIEVAQSSENVSNDVKDNPIPKIGEFWSVKNGNHTLFSTIANENPLTVQYFEPTQNGRFHVLDDKEFEAFIGDFYEKIAAPEMVSKGTRVYYTFSD